MDLKPNERIDDLEYKGLKIIQDKDGFCFGVDSVLLSDWAKNIKAKSKVIDIGTGTGIISILLTAKSKLDKIYGIEIQQDVAEMAKRSVELNNLQDKIEIINCNIKDVIKNKIFEIDSIDAIVTNPPYMKLNTGNKNEDYKKLVSRHELECNIEDIAKISSKLLRTKGEFYMIHRIDRMIDVICALRENRLEPKEIRIVQSNKTKDANLFLIKCVKDAGKELKMYPPLIIYNDDGTYTDEILDIYNKKKD
jgi:tRNA1Val (adenine37-N6)-methyltransferase